MGVMGGQSPAGVAAELDGLAIADEYRRFAQYQARGHSPLYEALSFGVAEDERLHALLHTLPPIKRQPNLLLAAARHIGAPLDVVDRWLDWVVANWADVSALMLARRTQTNESARCATLLPLLAALPQPLALIEVGASAGLCLYPDRYRYRYDHGEDDHDGHDRRAGGRGDHDRSAGGRSEVLGPADSAVVLPCRTNGPVPIPRQLPTVVWRAGVDLNPLDPASADDAGWLESLVWPEQTERLERLRGALAVAGAEPAHLVRGDLNETVRRLVAEAPAGATTVVFHSAVLAYLNPQERARFARTMRELPCHWISNEAPDIFPELLDRLPESDPVPSDRAAFLLALDERPVAFTGPHGERLDWFAGVGDLGSR